MLAGVKLCLEIFLQITAYSNETIDILRLIRSEVVGHKTFLSLIKFFGSASRALENAPDFSLRGGKSKPIKLYFKSDACLEGT